MSLFEQFSVTIVTESKHEIVINTFKKGGQEKRINIIFHSSTHLDGHTVEDIKKIIKTLQLAIE